jgi:hypothetical protein
MWVKNNPSDGDKQKGGQTGPGLKVAGSGADRKEDDGIGVMMSMDKDEVTRKMERDAEAEAKRQQNALPAWHLKSTISGDLTALGVKEHARAEVADGLTGSVTSSSNDDILRGLGVVGSTRPEVHSVRVAEDVKPVINRESDCGSSRVKSGCCCCLTLTAHRLRPVLCVTGGIDGSVGAGDAFGHGCVWRRRLWGGGGGAEALAGVSRLAE